jgi:hypothetical protein
VVLRSFQGKESGQSVLENSVGMCHKKRTRLRVPYKGHVAEQGGATGPFPHLKAALARIQNDIGWRPPKKERGEGGGGGKSVGKRGGLTKANPRTMNERRFGYHAVLSALIG